MDFISVLKEAVDRAGTDVHLTAFSPPRIRIDGRLVPTERDAMTPEATAAVAEAILTPLQHKVLDECRSIDFAFTADSVGRFRVNIFYEHGRIAVAFRKLSDEMLTLAQLGLPAVLGSLVELRDGLVLVTGPTGSGKTTTLATLIDMINSRYAYNIITIEDPIEYVHAHRKSIVQQRELHTDVRSFDEALRFALREDPDVILVGEMRDLDTMRTAIMAAETGHLVFSTLHCRGAGSAIERMVGIFPADEQAYIRQQLSASLRATVSQRLLRRRHSSGRVPAVEIMFNTSAISNIIRTGKTEQMYSAIETGSKFGMQTMEQSLCELYFSGAIDRETAIRAAMSPKLIEERIKHNVSGLRAGGA